MELKNIAFFRKLGRRGLILILCGLVWTLYGANVVTTPARRFSVRGNQDLLSFLDSTLWGYLWLACGVTGFCIGLFRSRQIIHGRDHYGFNAILTPPIVWGLGYLWAVAINTFSGYGDGTAFGVTGFLVWVLVTFFVLVIAGWPDPQDPVEVIIRKEDVEL